MREKERKKEKDREIWIASIGYQYILNGGKKEEKKEEKKKKKCLIKYDLTTGSIINNNTF